MVHAASVTKVPCYVVYVCPVGVCCVTEALHHFNSDVDYNSRVSEWREWTENIARKKSTSN